LSLRGKNEVYPVVAIRSPKCAQNEVYPVPNRSVTNWVLV
jgi:hypothetical protein